MVDIAIIGAGFSGSLLAIQVLRANPTARVFLIERAETFGRGLTYGAADLGHLLNVRATNMSAFPDDPNHFVEWLQVTSQARAAPTFVSRQVFGSYLQALLSEIVQTKTGAGRLVAIGDEVVGVTLDGSRPRLHLAVGRELGADHIVLATGNLPPHDLACFSAADPKIYLSDPWAADGFVDWPPDDDVLLVGTGLTTIDMILRLRSHGHRGSITALSRRGLRPRRHADASAMVTPLSVPSRPSLTALLRQVREEAEGRSWNEVVDALRPHVQRLWQEAAANERQRFIRHLRPWWDVHRHRVAPVVSDVIDYLVQCGRVVFAAGRIDRVDFGTKDVAVTCVRAARRRLASCACTAS